MAKVCNLCESNKLEIVYKFPDRKILRCRFCNLIFTETDNINLQDYYGDNKYSDMILNDFRLDVSHADYARRILNSIIEFKQTGKILDVGCGPGFFLDCARRQGWQTFGIELTEGNFRYAKDVLGLDVFKGYIEEAAFDEDYFDVITMWDVIEHIKDPSHILKRVYSLLRDNGLLCIETPNASSIYHLILRRRWISFAEVSHIYFFNPKALVKILNKIGFKVIKIETANVNFFSREGLRRLRVYSYIYDLELIINKLISALFKSYRQEGKSSQCKNEELRKFKYKFINFINYPTNLLFNRLLMGDQLRIYASKSH